MAQGDHIYIDYGFYSHHGIDCGDGTVIHFSKKKGRVSQDTIHSFACGNRIYTKQGKHRYSPEQVVQRAKSKLGETEYNLGLNNCEHFATWCHSGQHHSKQVGNFVEPAAVAGLSAALGAIPVTTAAPGLLGLVGITTTVGLGALFPVGAILGGAYIAYKVISDDD
ncbi:MAG: lecithin retinol acyltransferase family protein [Coleofasciculus sp. S288]|nr:lecithin retinol acyltransferase family protein [Coleofasciculus sp. S288]